MNITMKKGINLRVISSKVKRKCAMIDIEIEVSDSVWVKGRSFLNTPFFCMFGNLQKCFFIDKACFKKRALLQIAYAIVIYYITVAIT